MERLQANDAETIFYAIDQNRTHLAKWLPFVSNTNEVKDSEAFIQIILSHREETRNEVYTIWYKGKFAGLIDFHLTDRINEKTEIGYWLIEGLIGHGIIHQCCQVLIGLAFEKNGMNRITIRCAESNVPSEKVARRLGFSYEGIERSGERYGDLFFDLKVFSLLKSESHEQSSISVLKIL